MTIDYPNSLVKLHRRLEGEYQSLPWPSKIRNIVVLTYVEGGRGDVAAAAKVIRLLQKICPDLCFDWVLRAKGNLDPASFLTDCDLSKIAIREWETESTQKDPVDLLIVGPTVFHDGLKYVESRIFREVRKKPVFGFLEIGRTPLYQGHIHLVKERNETYEWFHPFIFPASDQILYLGLIPGSGLFLEKTPPLSREYCCPTYLSHLENEGLRKDIQEIMGNYDTHSLNFGYAHIQRSWERFIDFVAVHEEQKQGVIVLNQKGAFSSLDTAEFYTKVLTPERIKFLKQQGYKKITVKGEEKGLLSYHLSNEKNGRVLSIILRPSFLFADMQRLQYAAERLLSTGDNSASESFAARCKLFLYENIDDQILSTGLKTRFVKQQVEIAQKIYPPLAELIDIGAKIALSKEDMDRVMKILRDPQLSKATFEFCCFITQNFDFSAVFEGSVKRFVWTRLYPSLYKVESDAMDEGTKSEILKFVKNEEEPLLQIHDFSKLRKELELHSKNS